MLGHPLILLKSCARFVLQLISKIPTYGLSTFSYSVYSLTVLLRRETILLLSLLSPYYRMTMLVEHTVPNLHFLSKNSTLISRENCQLFWGWKTRENVVVLGFLVVDNFDFTKKIVKKKIGWKTRETVGRLSKLNFWSKIWLFEKCVWAIYGKIWQC